MCDSSLRPEADMTAPHSRRSRPYSMILSALIRSECGIVIPSAFAVLPLMTNSNFVGCSTGRSQV